MPDQTRAAGLPDPMGNWTRNINVLIISSLMCTVYDDIETESMPRLSPILTTSIANAELRDGDRIAR